jgi:cell wall-associated NlpC family hydrolase
MHIIRRVAAPGAVCALVLLPLAGCAARGGTPRPFPVPRGPAAVERHVPSAADPAGAASLLETAMSQLGTRYRAGGDAPERGFDCSGFVAWVFGRHGLALPRTVGAQYSAGRPVGNRPPGPADLVFFHTEGSGATHVGIALGDGRFIHAPSSRGVVRVEPLESPYWARRFLGARRVLDEAGTRPPS